MSVGWSVEWRIALRRRRLLALNTAIPLLLVAPVAVGAAPAHHGAAVVAVLFVVFGVFGSAIPLVRDAESGLLSRWILGGVRPGPWLAGRTAAQTLLDLVELTPSLLLLALLGGADVGDWASLTFALCIALLVANTLGIWVAAAARSLAEGALFGAVTALLLLHGSGVFRAAAPGTWQARIETWIPFRALHESLLATLGAGPPQVWHDVPVLVATVAFAGLTMAGAGPLLGRLSNAVNE